MPPLSPCGAIVDYVRSAYRSRWRFFKNSPERETLGRFYFVPEDSPVFPYPHYFYAGTWNEGDPAATWELGPVKNAPKQWIRGDHGLPNLPPGIPLGNREDFTRSMGADEIFEGPLRAGIPEVCWTGHGFPLRHTDDIFAIGSCCLRLAYLRLIEWVYDDEWEKVQDFITSWLGVGPTIHFWEREGIFPAVAIVSGVNFAIVFLTGTTTIAQTVTQLLQGSIRPRNQGGVNSTPVWANFARLVMQRMNEVGVGGDTPVLLAGHSYGGASGAVAAALLRVANPGRHISLLTWGSPKPGDAAMQAILRTVKTVHTQNWGDVVTVVPFDHHFWGPLRDLIPQFVLTAWGEWRPYTVYKRLDDEGNETEGPLQELAQGTVIPIALHVWAGQLLRIGHEHTTGEYIRRAQIGCGGPCTVIDPPSWEILFPTPQRLIGGVELRGRVGYFVEPEPPPPEMWFEVSADAGELPAAMIGDAQGVEVTAICSTASPPAETGEGVEVTAGAAELPAAMIGDDAGVEVTAGAAELPAAMIGDDAGVEATAGAAELPAAMIGDDQGVEVTGGAAEPPP